MKTEPHSSSCALRVRFYRGIQLAGLLVLLVGSLWSSQSHARLDPYYLLRGLSVGQIKPRILFVLDTSGSMTWESWNTNLMCEPDECEDTTMGTERSRINTAREAIRTVIADVGGTANFGLMTFDMQRPPTHNGEIPQVCTTQITETTYDWEWVCNWYQDCDWEYVCQWEYGWYYQNGWQYGWYQDCYWDQVCTWQQQCGWQWTGTTTTTTVDAPFQRENRMYNLSNNPGGGYPGPSNTGYFYRLCGQNKPYPYLRWDELGYDGSQLDNKLKAASSQETGDLPASPMQNVGNTSTAARQINETRRVQYFPDFLGVRVNLNSTTDPTQEILKSTFGSYANPLNGANTNPTFHAVSSAHLTEVWEQDFYYWPYVDGFVGYSYYATRQNNGNLYDIAGVQERLWQNGATLYSPFYLEGAGGLTADKQGPSSLSEAMNKALAVTSNQNEGGVDATGGTPWTDVIGTIPGTATADNSPYSHSTVASYLKFATDTLSQDACVPTATLLISDGQPNCGTCTTLYSRLAALRNDLDVSVYMVGFLQSGSKMQSMACAGAGASGDDNPCNDPAPAGNWDTCKTPGDPSDCAYIAADAQQLAAQLAGIVNGIIEADIEAGPGSSAIDTGVGAGGAVGEGSLVATSITAETEYPEWRGHVRRQLCDDIDPDTGMLEDYCVDQAFQGADVEETFGPCPQGREWDAADCLFQTAWSDRRIYFTDTANNAIDISNASAFAAALNEPTNEVPGGPYNTTDAQNIANYIKGKDWPTADKLVGLANSAPIIIRRVPRADSGFSPQVGIRDPHCAGRRLGGGQDVDPELVAWSQDAWDDSQRIDGGGGFALHHQYQEAIVIGSDLGLIHFFQFDSGNEMAALMPRYHIKNAVEQYNNFMAGGSTMGQPSSLEDHVFGVAATANNTWVYDEVAAKWRHVLVMGSGIGGKHYIALDVSHLSPASPQGPFEVLWTTQDTKSDPQWIELQSNLGESWARPAISYWLENDHVEDKPKGIVTLAAGYPLGSGGSQEGRYLGILDATTGDVIDHFSVAAPNASDVYENDFGLVSDTAVASQCISRYWGEAQEMYFNDPAGRLFRLDINKNMDHENTWAGAPSGGAQQLTPVFTFPACQSTGATCSITGDKNDVFVFSPAVAAVDRIDEVASESGVINVQSNDRYLLAMASGSLHDDSIDGGDDDNDFHSSLYIIADNHNGAQGEDPLAGITIPNGGDRTAPGADPGFARVILTDLERTRTFTPFDGATEYVETKNFNKGTRPVGAPLIRVSQGGFDTDPDPNVTNLVPEAGVEFYYVEYLVYEPPNEACDLRFKDGDTWYADEGSTYNVTFRIAVNDGDGFDLQNGNGNTYNDGDGDCVGLCMQGAVQNENCEDGVCGPKRGTPKVSPCDPNVDPTYAKTLGSRAVGYSELSGFNPYERNL